jgi:hypothetical protein
MPTDDESTIDSPVPFGDSQLDSFERSTVRAAYESLPERWRSVLWHLEVEGHKPQELAEALDVSPNSVSALVYRARSGLRQAYLQQHVAQTEADIDPACVAARTQLPGLVQQSATARETRKTETHLASCADCTAVYEDLAATGVEIGITPPTMHTLAAYSTL